MLQPLLMNNLDTRVISNLRKRRGVICGSITHLGYRLKELEGAADQPATRDHTQQLDTKLEALDSEFKTHNCQLINLISSDDERDSEGQGTLDKHDDDLTTLAVGIWLNKTRIGRPDPEEREMPVLAGKGGVPWSLNIRKGIQPTENKVRAIRDAPVPQSALQLYLFCKSLWQVPEGHIEPTDTTSYSKRKPNGKVETWRQSI